MLVVVTVDGDSPHSTAMHGPLIRGDHRDCDTTSLAYKLNRCRAEPPSTPPDEYNVRRPDDVR
ncbi:MAG: hypothetical protein ORO03_10480, partial [Alphaproteobacteria bacterium]|nr:hypothetical protein [Alphaproteobacteria bacterium]